jgi:hypothetical protein
MKLTKSKLQQIIKEELNEYDDDVPSREEIVILMAKYFGVTIEEAEIMFRSFGSN